MIIIAPNIVDVYNDGTLEEFYSKVLNVVEDWL